MSQETTTNITDASRILQQVDKTLNVIGTEKLLEILIYSRKNNIQITEEQIKYSEQIIQIICDEFGISLLEFYSSKRKNNRRNAIGVCALFLQDEVGLDNSNISYILKKPENLTSIYKNEIVSLNPSHKVDVVTLEKIKNIKNKLNTLKNER
jgi:chromosomal replication initiation ATPase DnaA